MVMKRLIGLMFAGALAFSAMAAEIVVKLAPPKIVVEKRSARPSPQHVWVQGITIGMAKNTCGPRENGTCHRKGIPSG